MKKWFVWLLLILMIATTGCAAHNTDKNDSHKQIGGDHNQIQRPGQTQQQQTTSITITVVGDLLMHMPVINSVKNPETGRYEFSSIFEPVRELIEDADYSIANLETRLAGPGPGYSGYPLFNCPADLAVEARKVGFDLFLTANNHSMDKGVAGVLTTLKNIKAAGMEQVGTYDSDQGKQTPLIKEIRGVKVGIMNYTSTTNGIPVPQDKPYLVNLVDQNAILAELEAMREANADIIIACIHFGTEYSRLPGPEQTALVEFLFGSGVDIVLGNHVHVVQPAQTLHIEENGESKKKFVVYSLGNFISNQRWRYSDSGLLVNLGIKKDLPTGRTELGEVKLIPTWVDTYREQGQLRYRILEVQQAIEDYNAGTDPLLTTEDYQRLKQVAEELGPEFLTLKELPGQ